MFQVFVFHEMTGYGWYMCCTYRLDQRWYRDTVALCFPYGMQRAFLLFQMDTTSARRFTAKRKAVLINVLSESFCTWFCEKIFCQLCPNFWGVRGAYVDEIRVQLAENQPQRQVQKDSESTLQNKGEFFLWKWHFAGMVPNLIPLP